MKQLVVAVILMTAGISYASTTAPSDSITSIQTKGRIEGIVLNDSVRVEPEVMIEGKLVDYATLKKLNPANIESMTVRKDSPEHPYGLIEIKLKNETTVKSDTTSTLRDIKVIGVGIQKR